MTDRTANLNPYPSEMRQQLWPLCCGASIISGFKGAVTAAALDAALDSIPYNQVYQGEVRKPELVFVCLNSGQATASPRKLLEERGFVEFMSSRNTTYGSGPDNLVFFVRSPMTLNFKVGKGAHDFKPKSPADSAAHPAASTTINYGAV